jgi:hypothetical protein
MAVAVMAFFGSSILAVHLMSQPGTPAAARSLPSAPAAPASVPGAPVAPMLLPGVPAVVSALPSAPPPGPQGQGEGDFPGSMDLGVAPVPPAAVSGEWERKVNDCVERKVHASGYDDVKPTLPGRWPALKRAREEKRLRRLAVRAACEKQLAR